MLDPVFDYSALLQHPFASWQSDELDVALFTRFRQFACSQPSRLAVVCEQQSWTYQEVLILSLAIAARFEPEDIAPIAILLPADGRLVSAFLGVLAVGCAYVPLDPNFPPARNRLILEQAGIKHIITDNAHKALLLQITDRMIVVDIDALEMIEPHHLSGTADSDAYILYTSGTTGQPKGVYQNQRGLLHDIYQYSHAIHINPNDKLTWLYSPSVLGAMRDIYGALLNGATLYSLNVKKIGLDGLAQMVAEFGITIFHAIPPLLRAFLHSRPQHQLLATVRLAYVSGDRFFAKDVDDFYRYFPRTALIYNGIGSTECATLYRHWFLQAATVLHGATVPVGYAIPERYVRLVDVQGNTVLDGEVGEVEVCSAFIAKGYWRNPTLSANSFYESPQHPQMRCFLTGDLARIQADGLMEYIGRKDGQVKIRGYRVELGVVEAELRQLSTITDASVLIFDGGSEPELIAYLVGQPYKADELRQQLQTKLPPASIPTQFYWLAEIPRLPNFKTDLAKLKQLNQHSLSTEFNVNGEREEKSHLLPELTSSSMSDNKAILTKDGLYECWNTALRRSGVVDDDLSFADYGGDSLKMLTLLVLIEEVFPNVIPVQLIHYDMTINSLWQSLHALTDCSQAQIHLFIVTGRQGVLANQLDFMKVLHPSIWLHVIPMPSLDIDLEQALTIAQFGQYVTDFIMKKKLVGAIHLLGLSFGARVVAEAACQLRAHGIKVSTIMAGDMGPSYQYQMNERFVSLWTNRFKRFAQLLGNQKQSASRGIDEVLMARTIRYLPIKSIKIFRQWIRWSVPKHLFVIYENIILYELVRKKVVGWHPPYFDGRLVVFVASDGIAKQANQPKDLGWSKYASSVQVINISGGHIDYMKGAGLETFVSHINGIVTTS